MRTKRTLGDLVSLQRGYDLTDAQRIPGLIPVMGSNGRNGWHNVARAPGPGVTIGRSGASAGVVTFVPGPYWPHNTALFVTDFKGNDPRFVSYLLSTLDLANFNSGSAQPSLNRNFLYPIETHVPPLSEQSVIAGILSAYDDVIENNERRIAILEEMAQRIFEEWFIHFRAPGCEGLPLVESAIGPIPKGWQLPSLGEVLSSLESGIRPKGGVKSFDAGVPSIGAENINGLGRYDFSKEKYIPRSFFDTMRRGHVQSGDVLLYKDGAHIGRKALFRDAYPHAECVINEHVFTLRASPAVSQTYLFFWLDTAEMTTKIKQLNANAAQPGINQEGVKGLPCLLPPISVIDKFTELSEPLLALLFNIAKSNQLLRAQRDLLLPKLISGEIDVTAASTALKEAAE